MTNFLWGFVIGAVLLDLLWAWKMGIVTLFWSRITRVFNRIFRK
jgi:hypothetical protein